MRSIFVLLIIFGVCSATAQTLRTPSFGRDALKMILTYDKYSTDSNFGNADGAEEPLGDGNTFSNSNINFLTSFSLKQKWEIFASLNYGSAESISNNTVRKQSTFTDLLIGGSFRWIEGRTSLYPGAFINIPFTSVVQDTEDVIVGESAMIIGFPFYADYKWKILAGYAGLTPLIFGDDRGWRYAYALGAKKRFGSLILNAEINGFDVIKDDGLTDEPNLRTDITDRVNAGSLRYFSINPGVMRFAVQARYRVARSFIGGLGFSKDLSGSRTSSGSSIIAYLEFRPKLAGLFGSEDRRDPREWGRGRRRRDYIEVREEDGLEYEVRNQGDPGLKLTPEEEKATAGADVVIIEEIYDENVDFNEDFIPETRQNDLKYFDYDPSAPPVKKRKFKKKKRKKRKKKRRKRKSKKRRKPVEEDPPVEDWE